ncbi:hypothetical protein ACTOB_001240 [Actinoplanes oblitus]|uniref:Uncharacterized protein n=1 Tax=Actinoplanes oblitus TaxID=3040509 RepID=A0ABY8WLI3_9ACTN|nr:hypothetical protein [Actinoplanes oblitus]WIM97692.1 hypothetical protein ACTOB_001240 [Actinoplanes oblitus]
MTRGGARKLGARIAGAVAEHFGRALRTLPGLAGALLVSFGLYLAWVPLGVIALGAFLLLIDRRVT